MEDLRKLGSEDGNKYTFEDAAFIADTNCIAIDSVVLAARSAMTWLQEVAKVVSKDGLPIRWTAPSGMLVSQDYRTFKGKVFESYITGKRVQLTLSIDSKDIDKRRMTAGISPNFVHAADASHMVSTVCRCVTAGVWHFAMIHDSFGTHAGNIDVLAEELRGAFVEQYTPDVLGAFKAELMAQLPEELAEKLPDVPRFGSLDIGAVNRSEYFFA
jgi:DNA-directed RNA polymerase